MNRTDTIRSIHQSEMEEKDTDEENHDYVNNFFNNVLSDISFEYKLGRTLGTGGFGTVFAGTRNSDGERVAIKCVPKKNVSEYAQVNGRRVPLEVYLLRQVSHVDGVIKLLDDFEHTDTFVIVMERPEAAMDLYDYIGEKRFLDECLARDFFHQIVRNTILCHQAGVIHRDIKDENILVDTNSRQLKLIDFGAGAVKKDSNYTEFSGTKVTAAPEWFQEGEYDGESFTVWTLGILLFNMVCGNIPYESVEEVVGAELFFLRSVSKDCEDLIRSCLSRVASERPNLEDIMRHPWMTVPENQL